MSNRRDLLRAVVAAPLSAWLPATTDAAQARPAARWIVIVDARLAAAPAFAAELHRQRAGLHALRGDVGDLWYGQLRPLAGQSTLVGLTTEASLFCLEMMARDQGLRLVHRDSGPALASTDSALQGRRAARALLRRARAWQALPMQLGPSLREPPPERLRWVAWALAPRRARAARAGSDA